MGNCVLAGSAALDTINLDISTNLRVSECVEVHLHTKRAKADSTKLKEHKAFAII